MNKHEMHKIILQVVRYVVVARRNTPPYKHRHENMKNTQNKQIKNTPTIPTPPGWKHRQSDKCNNHTLCFLQRREAETPRCRPPRCSLLLPLSRPNETSNFPLLYQALCVLPSLLPPYLSSPTATLAGL
jgi:hypothetical protein